MVQLSKIIDENRDRKVTLEEWNNWVNQRKKMGRDERFLNDYPDYHAWEKFFFELSKGTQEIKLSQLETYIKPDDFKMKKEILKRSIKSYAKVVKKANFDEDGVVTLDEWLAWITQKKTNLDRRKFMLKPWKSFIVVLTMIQLIIGIGDRAEKYSVCGWNNYGKQHCQQPRPFHGAKCLGFSPLVPSKREKNILVLLS